MHKFRKPYVKVSTQYDSMIAKSRAEKLRQQRMTENDNQHNSEIEDLMKVVNCPKKEVSIPIHDSFYYAEDSTVKYATANSYKRPVWCKS